MPSQLIKEATPEGKKRRHRHKKARKWQALRAAADTSHGHTDVGSCVDDSGGDDGGAEAGKTNKNSNNTKKAQEHYVQVSNLREGPALPLRQGVRQAQEAARRDARGGRGGRRVRARLRVPRERQPRSRAVGRSYNKRKREWDKGEDFQGVTNETLNKWGRGNWVGLNGERKKSNLERCTFLASQRIM